QLAGARGARRIEDQLLDALLLGALPLAQFEAGRARPRTAQVRRHAAARVEPEEQRHLSLRIAGIDPRQPDEPHVVAGATADAERLDRALDGHRLHADLQALELRVLDGTERTLDRQPLRPVRLV